MDEGKARQQIERAQLARNVLENPLFKEIAEEIAKDYRTAFLGEDTKKAWETRRQALVFDRLLTKLKSVLAKEKDAILHLDKAKRLREAKKLGNLPERTVV